MSGPLTPLEQELFRLTASETGLELAVRRRECSAAALRVLRGTRAMQETILLFEDVDRYDRPSRAVVERLVEGPGDGPLCVIATASRGRRGSQTHISNSPKTCCGVATITPRSGSSTNAACGAS